MSFRLQRGRPCDAELRRVTLYQIGLAETHCRNVADNPLKAPHEARKAIKKIRATLRLARSADPEFYRAENARWRDISAALAGPREMAALIETVDRFIGEFGSPANRTTLLTLRARLVVRLDALSAETSALEAAAQRCVQGCAAAKESVVAWNLPSGRKAGAHLLARGVKAAWNEAEAARKRAARLGEEDDFHDLRKAVKRHWTHLGLLQDFWPGPVKQRRKAVEALGEALGELNDIYVMESLIRAGEIEMDFDPQGQFTHLLAQKRQTLWDLSLTQARRLFAEPPRQLKTTFESASTESVSRTERQAEVA